MCSVNVLTFVLMDINLGKLSENDGLTLARRLLKVIPDLKIIILTGYDLPVYRHEAKNPEYPDFLTKI